MRLKYLICIIILVVGCKNNEENQFSLVVEITGQGETNISSSIVDANQQVQLIASPNENWTFSNWSGDVNSSDNPINFIMNEN